MATALTTTSSSRLNSNPQATDPGRDMHHDSDGDDGVSDVDELNHRDRSGGTQRADARADAGADADADAGTRAHSHARANAGARARLRRPRPSRPPRPRHRPPRPRTPAAPTPWAEQPRAPGPGDAAGRARYGPRDPVASRRRSRSPPARRRRSQSPSPRESTPRLRPYDPLPCGLASSRAPVRTRSRAPASPRHVETSYGSAELTEGHLGGLDILHVSRHGAGHKRLSSQVEHRANIAALRDLGADAILAVTVCGAVDRSLALASSSSSTTSGSGQPAARRLALHAAHRSRRSRPRALGLRAPLPRAPARRAARGAAGDAGLAVRDGGCYTAMSMGRASTRARRSRCSPGAGVVAVSQTAGPETVLAGEAGIPYALLGFVHRLRERRRRRADASRRPGPPDRRVAPVALQRRSRARCSGLDPSALASGRLPDHLGVMHG